MTYDIFRKLPDGAPIWIEAVDDLQHVRNRLADLKQIEPGEYVVYDLSSQQVVAAESSIE